LGEGRGKEWDGTENGRDEGGADGRTVRENRESFSGVFNLDMFVW